MWSGPQPDAGRDGCGHLSYAHKLGVENMAAKAIQGRAVMVDLEKHYGRDHKYVNYDDFKRVLDADKVVVEPGDMLLLYTGFTDEIVKMNKKVDPARAHAMCCVLDGRDKRLLQWITDSQISALIADNYGVEAVPAQARPGRCRASVAADPQSLPVQARPESRRDLVAEGPGAVAARQEALALPADRPAAAPARRRRLAGHAGGDGLGLLLPAARRRLLPVDDACGRPPCRPSSARGVGDGVLVAAVEQFEAALVVGDPVRARAIGDEQERGAVGVLVEMGQPDRLALGLAVARRAVRQEAVGVVGPEMGVERIDALGRAQQHDRALARLQGLHQQARQRVFQRRLGQVVEVDLGRHLASLSS